MRRAAAAIAAAARRRPDRGVVALVLAVAVATGCTGEPTGAAVPDSVPTVEVDLADADLTVHGPVPAGRVVFHVRNTGEDTHRLVLFPLAEDRPPIHADIADDTERAMRVTAGVPPLDSGETARFAVDLAAGQRYAMVDTIKAPGGGQYMDRGVATEFRTRSPDSPASPGTPATPPSPSPGS